MRFDTTPRANLARPAEALIRAAIRAVPTALTEDVLTIRHSNEPWPIEWLVTCVVQRDHPEAAARWAIHDLVQSGMFDVSENGEIDLSATDWMWDWWCDGTVNLESNQTSELSNADLNTAELSNDELSNDSQPDAECVIAEEAPSSPVPSVVTPRGSSSANLWYARSRARVAIGLLMTSPDLSTTFLGREILADEHWNENRRYADDPMLLGDGLQSDKDVQDHLRFTRELVEACGAQPAFRGNQFHLFHAQRENRVVAFHRWIEGTGHDVVVVVSLNESTWWDYRLGFPRAGRWRETFNSDVYENWFNPGVAGNGGGIVATDAPMHGLPASAQIVIPANSILVFVPA